MRYVLAIVGLIAVALISNYPARMEEYNAHVCEVYGKQPDCVTPLEVK